MNEAKANVAAREVLNKVITSLDDDIAWKEGTLVDTLSSVAKQRADLDAVRQKRSALSDAVRVHFPVATF